MIEPNFETPLRSADNPAYQALLEAGDMLFRKPCTFVKGVVDMAHLPPADRLEVAFAGRSNVGKSSLLNALTNRRNLARSSNTPGRTRELNFFDLANLLWLVDLPGYGYAQASKTDIARWTALTRTYLKGRPTLRRIYLLIDARHGPKAIDQTLMAELDEAAVSYQIVLTKIDKIKQAELDKILTKTQQEIPRHPAAYPEILMTSSAKGTGLPDLRAAVAALTV